MLTKQTQYKKRKNLEGFQYREGPSSIEDEQILSGNITEDDSPRGLNECVPYSPEKVDDISELAGSEVLVVYFAKLANSHKDTHADLNYLNTLIKSGAKVNYTDLHGQTVLHEIALHWPLEVADFFLQHGSNLNQGDSFGRMPLHAAASVNYPEMIKWLVENGADIHARTLKENQSPIHYASKYNSTEALSMLITLGARLDDRDYKERTPLQLAAETGREEACRLLMENGAPAGVYDDTGTSCLAHMIEKMPDVAAEALEQFHRIDKASRTVYYYLSYLEIQKWQILRTNHYKGRRLLPIREPLEAIIRYNESRLIMHPVIQRLLAKKLELYGRRTFLTDLLINFIFTVIWTALTVALPGPKEKESGQRVKFYEPFDEKAWRVVLEALGLMLAIYFVFKTKIESSVIGRAFQSYKIGRIQEIKRDLMYCHPRWPQEGKFIQRELNKVELEEQASLYDVWYWLDVSSFLGLLFLMITRLILIIVDYDTSEYQRTLELHYHAYPFVLIIIWLRFMQAFRPFITLGPFIAMLGYVASDTMKFAFLFCEFFIPYCCAIWIVFGNSDDEDNSFRHFNDLMFEVLRMTVVDSFEFGDLTKQNKIVAQLICGTYLALTSITCLNLYIALLSETFSRVFGNATATAYMLQGEALISVEKKLPYQSREAMKNYIAENCSPEAVYGATEKEGDENSAVRDIMSEMDNLRRQCEAIRKLQNEMKQRSIYFKTEAVDIIGQQDELMQDIDDSLKYMTES